VVPGDVPDLPGLVLAKLFKVLHRTDIAIAPEHGGKGCVAIGVSLPLAEWIPGDAFDLNQNPFARLSGHRAPEEQMRTRAELASLRDSGRCDAARSWS
jgi:hypothetical protein